MAGIGFLTNIAALAAQRQLSVHTDSLKSSFQRLSSGLRINRASDDAASLAIAKTLEADSLVLAAGARNISDGISATSIAEGALNELSAITIRQKELAEQSANGSLSNVQRKALNSEAKSLTSEFNRIVQTTTFNGKSLIDVQQIVGAFNIQAGYGTAGQIGFSLGTKLARTTGSDQMSQNFDPYSTQTDLPGLVTAADFTGDGIADVSISTDTGTTLYMFAGTSGSGLITPTVGYDLGFGSGSVTPVSLDSADINNDGAQDIIYYAAEGISVLLGNGNGTFKAAQTALTTASGGYVGDIADFNGDGYGDLVIPTSGGTYVLLANNNGTFKAALQIDGVLAQGAAAGDINGDGKIDIVSSYGSQYRALFGNGNGTFSAGPSAASTGSDDRTMLADLNLDGNLDLLILSTGTGTVRTALGNGNGTFGTLASNSLGGSSNPFGLADFNGDGYLDLFSPNNGYSIALNRGDGTFGSSSTNLSGYPLTNSAAGDFNNDGALDVISPYSGSAALLNYGLPRSVDTIAQVSIATRTDALAAIPIWDAQLKRVNLELGLVGSVQSRLTSAFSALETSRLADEDAHSRIMDADVAEESSRAVKARLLQEATQSVLAQANNIPALALRLLSGNSVSRSSFG